jgi:hypothetical protein
MNTTWLLAPQGTDSQAGAFCPPERVNDYRDSIA